MIRELQKAEQEGILHVTIKDNKIYESLGPDNNKWDTKLIPGKKIFPVPQEKQAGAQPAPTGKVPGDDMGEFASYMWDQDRGESGLFKYHNSQKGYDNDPLGESNYAKNVLKENFERIWKRKY